MHSAIAIGVAVTLAALGCADAESDLEPHTPVNAQLVDHTDVRAPEIVDGFPHVFAIAQSRTPLPQRSRTVSLGFIGDAPLGTEPTPPHQEPAWTRPFPCHWTGTCFSSRFLP
jgi:hypothetical protein